ARGMPTMLMLAQGNHVANAQRLACSRRILMSYSQMVKKFKAEGCDLFLRVQLLLLRAVKAFNHANKIKRVSPYNAPEPQG
ncbi:hypothetical protein, partial [Pseudomonas sp. PB106]|uniref:hypothetical protein n=1 Tax=Pseudomonas sp. PB106 TaxID=2494699 RepID=UPI001C49B280